MAMRRFYQDEGGGLWYHSVGMVPVGFRPQYAENCLRLNGNITLAGLDNIRTWGTTRRPAASQMVSFAL